AVVTFCNVRHGTKSACVFRAFDLSFWNGRPVVLVLRNLTLALRHNEILFHNLNPAVRIGGKPLHAFYFGCWYRPITLPAGSRNRAVISGASAPIGCTISPPAAITASIVAATLSTMM